MENPERYFSHPFIWRRKILKAKVEIMDSFSAHGDHNELLQFMNNLNRERLKKLFLVHGDFEAQLALKRDWRKMDFNLFLCRRWVKRKS